MPGHCRARSFLTHNPRDYKGFSTFWVAALLAPLLRLGTSVDCWIGVVQEVDFRVVRLAGQLSAAQVPELLKACADASHVRLDLSDLVSADTPGIDALRRVRANGADLVGVPGYIQLKIDSEAARPQSSPKSKEPRRI